MSRPTLTQYATQLRASALAAQASHDALIAAGAVWDGMDGYSFVNEVTTDDLERIMGALPPWANPEPTP